MKDAKHRVIGDPVLCYGNTRSETQFRTSVAIRGVWLTSYPGYLPLIIKS